MPANLILDLFYNEIVKEAQTGRIDCFFMMNIAFNLTINNKQITHKDSLEYQDVIIPTLHINNKELFDTLLVEYVNNALAFYDPEEFSFLSDVDYIQNDTNTKDLKEKYLIKYIICTLLANASYIDFEDPITFLQNRIHMIQNPILNTNTEIDLGYFDTIQANLHIIEEKAPIKAETPYRIKGYVEYDDGYQLLLPEIYMGNSKDTYQIYGIQKTSKQSPVNETPYIKQIRKGLNSRLYAVPEHYFLTYILSLLLSKDKQIEVIPFLVERWNGKAISLYYKKGITDEEKEKYKEVIQKNITDTFLRAFLKLEEVTDGLDILGFPFTIDDRLHLNLDNNFTSKASVFHELDNKLTEYKSQYKKTL